MLRSVSTSKVENRPTQSLQPFYNRMCRNYNSCKTVSSECPTILIISSKTDTDFISIKTSINPLHPANPLTGETTIKNSQQR